MRAAKRKPRSKAKPAAVERFTASQIVMRNPADLVPFPNNPKLHPPEQIDALARVIAEFGFDQPILLDEHDTVLKGHGRRLASLKLDLPLVPTIVHAGLSIEDKIAIVLSDNQLPTLSGFDQSLLRVNLTTLAKADYALELTGYNDVRLAAFGIGDGAPQSDPDEEQEPSAVEISRLGDIWHLGKHRVACGNSTDKKTVEALLGGDEPHLMVTDPPYGVEYDPSWSDGGKNGKRAKSGKAPSRALGKVLNDDQANWQEAWDLFPGNVAYVWHADREIIEVAKSLRDASFEIRALIVWAKNSLIITRGHYHYQHESCLYAVRKGKTAEWSGDKKQSTLWTISSERNSTGHGTQKPVECMKRPIENNSKVGDSIYEPFAGSGTTIIAAEMTGRTCLAVELSPAYVDVCVRRWQTFAGKKATLVGGKRTFEQIERERSKSVAA